MENLWYIFICFMSYLLFFGIKKIIKLCANFQRIFNLIKAMSKCQNDDKIIGRLIFTNYRLEQWNLFDDKVNLSFYKSSSNTIALRMFQCLKFTIQTKIILFSTL